MELRRRPGTQREIDLRVPLAGLAVSGSEVPADADLAIEATLEAAEGAVTMIGTVTVPWAAECRRCLDDVGGTMVVDVSEVFEAHPTDGETYPLDGDEIDLEPVVRDAALLNLPLAPLCDPECSGPAPDRFPATTAAAPGRADPKAGADPRWAALDQLRFEPD